MEKNIFNLNEEKLQKWEKNQLINPCTNKKIKFKGPTYNKLVKKFEDIFKRKPYGYNKNFYMNYMECLNLVNDPIKDKDEEIKKYVEGYVKLMRIPIITNKYFPTDLITQCLIYLPLTQILNCRIVSKEWYKIINGNSIWNMLLIRDFKINNVKNSFSQYKKFY